MTRVATRLEALANAVGSVPLVDLVTRISLLLAVINAREEPLLMVATAGLAVVALARRWHRVPALWFAVGLVHLLVLVPEWEGLDDHVVATSYWALGLGLSLRSSAPEHLVAWNGRILAGLIFGFAAFWKLTSGDFIDGDFFRYTLLLDSRFEYLAQSVGGLSEAEYLANHAAARSQWVAMPGPEAVSLIDTGRIRAIATVMTAWGVASEMFAALVLLAPLRGRAEWLRHGWILAFCATTYAVVPIGGFGALLATLGLAQTGDRGVLRLAYLTVFFGMLVYGPVWRLLFFT